MTTTGQPRNPVTMPAHALALTCRQSEQDKRDAHRMHIYARLRLVPMSSRARMVLVSGMGAT